MIYPEFHHLGFKIVIAYLAYQSILAQNQNVIIKARQLEQLAELNNNMKELRQEVAKINGGMK